MGQIFRQSKQGWFVSSHSLGSQLKDLESSEVLTEAGRSAFEMAHLPGWQIGFFPCDLSMGWPLYRAVLVSPQHSVWLQQEQEIQR